jgi:hypothetical protein
VVKSSLSVAGLSLLASALSIGSSTVLMSTLSVGKQTVLTSTLSVAGASVFASTLSVGSNVIISKELNVSGDFVSLGNTTIGNSTPNSKLTSLTRTNTLALDGTNDYVIVPYNSVLDISTNSTGDAVTMETWLYPVTTQAMNLMVKGNYGYGIILNMDTRAVSAWTHISGAGAARTVSNVFAEDTWNHIAVIMKDIGSSVFVSVYVNGSAVEMNHQATSGQASALSNGGSSSALYIGTQGSGAAGGNCVNGNMSNIRLWNTDLSAETISTWYNKEIDQNHPNYANLVGNWTCDQSSGNLTDISGNGLHGTLTNGPVYESSSPNPPTPLYKYLYYDEMTKIKLTGNTFISGSLSISGNVIMNNGGLSIGGNIVASTISVSGALTAGGLTYPTANGTDGYVLTSEGNGTVAWEAASGGSSTSIALTQTLSVAGLSLLASALSIGSSTVLMSTLSVGKQTVLASTLSVGGASNVIGYSLLASDSRGATFVSFAHKDNTGQHEYAVLQGGKNDDGHTYLNAYSGKRIYFAVGGSSGFKMALDTNALSIGVSTKIESTLSVGGATTMESTLSVGGVANLTTLAIGTSSSSDNTNARVSVRQTQSNGTVLRLENTATGSWWATRADSSHAGGMALYGSTREDSGQRQIYWQHEVNDTLTFNYWSNAGGETTVYDAITLGNDGAIATKSTLSVAGASVLSSTLSIGSSTVLMSTLSVGKQTVLASTLSVGGVITGDASGLTNVPAATTGTVLALTQTLSVGANVMISKQLNVRGNVNVYGNLTLISNSSTRVEFTTIEGRYSHFIQTRHGSEVATPHTYLTTTGGSANFATSAGNILVSETNGTITFTHQTAAWGHGYRKTSTISAAVGLEVSHIWDIDAGTLNGQYYIGFSSSTAWGGTDYNNNEFSIMPYTVASNFAIREGSVSRTSPTYSATSTIKFRIALLASGASNVKAQYFWSEDGGSESSYIGTTTVAIGTALYLKYGSPASGYTVVIKDFKHKLTTTPANNAIDFYLCDGTANNSSDANVTATLSLYNSKVGIGTTTPDYRLEVEGSVGALGVYADTFTGQHRPFIDDYSLNTLENLYGLIVSANKNDYTKLNGTLCKGKNAITISESLPDISLTNVDRDKSVFGVISSVESSTTRIDEYGGFISKFEKESGDTRPYINSLGEGAIWVSNKNSSLVSGDYITSSSVPGYGMKQDDDILHNYTVAKITMDCDFNPPTQSVKNILKDGNGNNTLDSNGFIQWVDSSSLTETKYDLRYLYANATQMTESTYNTNLVANVSVYKSAFVGCTYHCG